MLIVGMSVGAIMGVLLIAAHTIRPHDTTSRAVTRRLGGGLSAAALVLGVPLLFAGSSGAADGDPILLGTADQYSVLAGSAVTNTGFSVLDGSLGVSPGTAVSGFPPGTVVPPSVQNVANGAAQQAKSDLTAAYVEATLQEVDTTVAADLGNQVLQPGVYATSDRGALLLTGPLLLDGGGDPNVVFVIRTDSSLTTATSSTVTLTGSAQACNVFWQIGSDATLGGSSVFVGNLLALTSITVGANATIEGRALARNGAVTLIDDDFTEVGCDTGSTTTTSTDEATTSTTATAAGPPGPTTTTPSAATPGDGTGTGSPTPDTPTDLTEQGTGSPDSPDSPPGITGGPTTPDSPPAITGGPATPDSPPAITEQGLGTPGGGTPALATTGSETTVPLLLAVLCFTLGAIAMRLGRQQDQVADRHA